VVVHDYEAEKHDRTSLDLPGDQDALVEAVAAANPHTVVVLETGSAVLMPWLDQVPAVLETWYPGETAGTALADVLSGRVDPSGKLPVTFPASATARPDATAATFGGVGGRTLYSDGVDVGYRWYDANDVTPAFPFGFGLTYTSFGFSKGSLAAGRDGWTASVSITNTGKVRGADVVQCYVGYPTVSDEAPRQLRAFQRVDLLPGQSEVVALHLTPGDLGQWSTAENQWIIAGGVYHVWMGDSSDLANLPVQLSTQVQPAQLGVDSGPAPVA
jgi:beta-glucosidase